MRIDNPGWDFLVAKGIIARLGDAESDLFHDSEQALRDFITRKEYCRRFVHTIASPKALEFIAEHSLGRVLDPMAGTGYWAYLLRQRGVDVKATDLHPGEENRFHRPGEQFVDVGRADMVDAVSEHRPDTMLMSWPPYQPDAAAADYGRGALALAAFDSPAAIRRHPRRRHRLRAALSCESDAVLRQLAHLAEPVATQDQLPARRVRFTLRSKTSGRA